MAWERKLNKAKVAIEWKDEPSEDWPPEDIEVFFRSFTAHEEIVVSFLEHSAGLRTKAARLVIEFGEE